MESSMWHPSQHHHIENQTYASPMKEEPLPGDVPVSQNVWETSDGVNVAEPVVEIKTAGDYLECVDGIPSDPHDRGGRPPYPYHPVAMTHDVNNGEVEVMGYYNNSNRIRSNQVMDHYQHKGYPMMEHPIDATKCMVPERSDNGMLEKTGQLMFSHSILEPETSNPHQNVLSISDVSPANFLKTFPPPVDMATTTGPTKVEQQPKNPLTDRYKSVCPFCGNMFSHVIAHMMTAHSSEPLVAEAMSHPKGSPQRRSLFIALKNKGRFLQSQFEQEGKEYPSPEELEKDAQNRNQKVACKYCSRHYKAHKIRYHYMKCTAYKESTNHNTFTFRREMRKQDHYKKCLTIMQSFPFLSEKVTSDILARMRQDKITALILNDPLLLKYAEVNCQGEMNTSLLLKIKQDLRNLGKLILTLRERDDSIQFMSDVLKPSSFGLVVRAVQEFSGFNSDTCSYEHTSTPMNTGYILRKCTDLLKEEAVKTVDEGLVQQCNEFADLLINDWKDCMNLDAVRNRKREKLPLLKDIQILQQFFDREMNIVLKKMEENKAASLWRRLSRLTLASVVLFNRGSSRKIDRMTMSDYEDRCTCEDILPELGGNLSSDEKQSLSSLTKISILETPGKIVHIILTPLHLQAVKLLNEMRNMVGVVDNPYIFARPGGETPLRSDIIREFAHRAGLEQPNNITPSNLRKHVIVTNHFSTFRQANESDLMDGEAHENMEEDKKPSADYHHIDAQQVSGGLHEMPQQAPENLHQKIQQTPENLHQKIQQTPENLHRIPQQAPEDLHQKIQQTPEDLHRMPQQTPEDLYQKAQQTSEGLHRMTAQTTDGFHRISPQTAGAMPKTEDEPMLESSGMASLDQCSKDDDDDDDKKEFNFRDCGNRYWFLGYNSSDFELESDDDSDYEPNRVKKGKGSKKKTTSRKRIVTGSGGPGDGMQDDDLSGSSNVRHYFRGKTRYNYCKWTDEEENIVIRAMDQHFKNGTLPGKQECLKIMHENRILQKRKWEDVKNFVRNKMIRVARMNSALQNSVREFCSAAVLSHSSSEL